MNKKYALLILFFFFLSKLAFAEARISEIMYDLSGSDTDREWVEVENTGTAPLDIRDWRFFEGGVNHKLKLISSDGTLAPHGFAIIAENADVFKTEWPTFSGTLFDSSFSLGQEGETIGLRTAELVNVDEVTYSKSMGANGDGNALSRAGGGFSPEVPTPGQPNASNSSSGPGSGSSQTEASPSASASQNNSPVSGASSGGISGFSVHADVPVQGASRIPIAFRAEAFYGRAAAASTTVYQWNFGDGYVDSGAEVEHTYSFPGNYIVTVTTREGENRADAHSHISITEPKVSFVALILGENGYVEIQNGNRGEVDLSGWRLSNENNTFIFPANTILASNASTRFSLKTISISLEHGTTTLEYPDGGSVATILPNVSQKKEIVATEVKKQEEKAQVSSPKVSTQKTTVHANPTPLIPSPPVGQNATATLVALATPGRATPWATVGLVVLLGVAGSVPFFLKKKPEEEIHIIEE